MYIETAAVSRDTRDVIIVLLEMFSFIFEFSIESQPERFHCICNIFFSLDKILAHMYIQPITCENM